MLGRGRSCNQCGINRGAFPNNKPCSANTVLTSPNSFAVNSCFSRRWRKCSAFIRYRAHSLLSDSVALPLQLTVLHGTTRLHLFQKLLLLRPFRLHPILVCSKVHLLHRHHYRCLVFFMSINHPATCSGVS